MPKSPPTVKDLQMLGCTPDCDDLLNGYDFEWKRSLPRDVTNRVKMQEIDFRESENSIPNNRLF